MGADVPTQDREEDLLWYAVHTKPRCEKKLRTWCVRNEITCELPTYSSLRKYRGKEVEFSKPLFPGYVFPRVPVSDAQFVYRSNYAVKLLKPIDQEEFSSQLSAIIVATENMEQIRLVPNISVGSRVVIRNGPLAGIEAWVQDRDGPSEVILRLDFIGQAAAVSLSVEELQLA